MSILGNIKKLFHKESPVKYSEANSEITPLQACQYKPHTVSEPVDLNSIKDDISKMNNDEIYSKSKFSVLQQEGTVDAKWYVYMNICQLGGCNYNGVSFETERIALEQSMLLTLQGKKPNCKHPCLECYKEYIKDCI